MKSFAPVLAAALFAGCAQAPEADPPRLAEVNQDPVRLHGYFMYMIRHDLEAKAAKVTTVDENALRFAIKNTIAPDLTRRLVLGFEQHSVTVAENDESRIARWCNKEFGISREYPLAQLEQAGKKYWVINFTRDQLRELPEAAMAWFRRQRQAADGRIYAYPPDWVAVPVMATCPCGR
jgi:hypothetical protein